VVGIIHDEGASQKEDTYTQGQNSGDEKFDTHKINRQITRDS